MRYTNESVQRYTDAHMAKLEHIGQSPAHAVGSSVFLRFCPFIGSSIISDLQCVLANVGPTSVLSPYEYYRKCTYPYSSPTCRIRREWGRWQVTAAAIEASRLQIRHSKLCLKIQTAKAYWWWRHESNMTWMRLSLLECICLCPSQACDRPGAAACTCNPATWRPEGGTVCGREFCSELCCVDRVSALSLASTWGVCRKAEAPGCLRRDVPAQGGNPAGKSARVKQ